MSDGLRRRASAPRASARTELGSASGRPRRRDPAAAGGPRVTGLAGQWLCLVTKLAQVILAGDDRRVWRSGRGAGHLRSAYQTVSSLPIVVWEFCTAQTDDGAGTEGRVGRGDGQRASGHEKIRVCGQLAPGWRSSFLPACGHQKSRSVASSLPASGVS
jgi:hypothetical protein